jgi:hypothetical protein
MAGVLLNYLPANQQEFEDLIRGIATDPVTRFRVSAPAWYFEPAYDWTLSESSRGVQESGGDPKPPRVNSLTVSQNGAQEATIDVTASDPNGVRDLQFIQIIINRNLNGAGACYLSYEAAENRLWLIADTGAGAAGVAALGAKTTLSNQQCGIATEEVSASIVETALSLHIPIKFTGPFSGTMQVFGEAIDRGGLHPGFHPLAKLILK